MKRLLRTLLLPAMLVSAVSAVLAGCGPESSDRWDRPLRVEGPLFANGRLVYLNVTFGEVVVVDPARSDGEISMEIEQLRTGEEPGLFARSNDGNRLFVVNEEAETFQIVDMSADAPEVTEVDIAAPYDRLWIDPQDDFVVLGFSGNASERTIVARNLNEVSIIDLRESEPVPERLTLASRPMSVEFAPTFALGGSDQRLAAVLSQNEITVLDLNAENEDDQLREVPLTTSEADTAKVPIDVAFDVTIDEDQPEKASLFTLTQNSSDITQIDIKLADGGRLKLDLSVTQLAAGSAPGDMAVLELPDVGTRLLAIDRNVPRFTLVDVDSGSGATFDLPMTRAARSLLIYRTTTTVDGEPREELRVLAHTPQSNLVSVIRPQAIAIAGDEPTLGQSVEAIRLELPPERIELSENQPDRAVVFHGGVGSGSTILNLRKNHDIPIQGGALRDLYFDGALAYVVFQELPNISIFDLEGNPSNFELPKLARRIFVDDGDGVIIVEHLDATGSFTVLDATEPTPENAAVFNEVFLHGLFDQELP